ncbi:MAG: MBL fold metallo-hydrolase [Clostridiales bacterium]|nr:MBL fold metallo-hydrolase [Candidatus Cacconaster stercorequi]
MPEIIPINQHTWRIEDDGVRFFLLEGQQKALLIDSGMNTPNAGAIARTLTALPLNLLNTHADPDHTAGNEAFGTFYMSPAEWENYHEIHHKNGTLLPVRDGDRIDLGGRELVIIDLPGHTPGSIAVLDVAARVLIGGDAIQDSHIFMFGARRNMARYIESLTALWHLHREKFDTVYPSHGTFPLPPSQIPRLIAGAGDIVSGKCVGKHIRFMAQDLIYYDVGCAGFLCDPTFLRE